MQFNEEHLGMNDRDNTLTADLRQVYCRLLRDDTFTSGKLPKLGKPPKDVKTYRLISLLPKLFENLLLKRLRPLIKIYKVSWGKCTFEVSAILWIFFVE